MPIDQSKNATPDNIIPNFVIYLAGEINESESFSRQL